MQIAQLPENYHFNDDNIDDSDQDIPEWKITEQKFSELQIKNLHFMERDDSSPNLECGNWYHVSKKFIQTEARLPPQLLKYYKIVVFFTFFSAIYWAFCCLMMPVVAMHAIERYISTDIRVQFSIYWFLQPLMYITFIYTMSKLTLVYVRCSIIMSLINICWHILNVVFQYSLSADRQDRFSQLNSIIYYVEIFLNLLLLISTIVLSKHMHMLFTSVYKQSQIENINMTPFQKKQSFKNQQQLQQSQQNGVQSGYNVNTKQFDDLERSIEKSDYPLSVNNTNDDFLNNSQVDKIQTYYNPSKMRPSQMANKKIAEKEKLSKLMQQKRVVGNDTSQIHIKDKNKISFYQDEEVYIQDQASQLKSTKSNINISQQKQQQSSFYQTNSGMQTQNQNLNRTGTILKNKKERDNYYIKKQNSKVSFQDDNLSYEENYSPLRLNNNTSNNNILSQNVNGSKMHRTQSIVKNQKFNLNTGPGGFVTPNKESNSNLSVIKQEFDSMKEKSDFIQGKQKWGAQRQLKLEEYQGSYEIQDTRIHKVEQDITKL